MLTRRRKKSRKRERLPKILNALLNDNRAQKGIRDLVIGRWPKINSRLIGSCFVKYLITDKPFYVAEDKCIKCGKCAEACPVNDIIWSKGSMPKWKHNGSCLSCFACYHHCPKHAIEYGKRTKTKDNISLKRMICHDSAANIKRHLHKTFLNKLITHHILP